MAIAFLKVIEWADDKHDEIVHKVNLAGNVINRGSKLTVREGQAAVFCDKGRAADVFGPGMYKLDTDSLPVITRLLSWAYAFETPYKSDVYFVSTRQFAGIKWGTANPVIVRDPDYGAVRVRGYGTFAFRVADPYKFLTELSGAHRSFTTADIESYILSILVMSVSDALGESGLSVLDLSGNLVELRGAAGDRPDRTDGAAARGAVCAKCGAPVGKAKFCPECGAPVRRVCAKCGAELGNAKFCPECGEKA